MIAERISVSDRSRLTKCANECIANLHPWILSDQFLVYIFEVAGNSIIIAEEMRVIVLMWGNPASLVFFASDSSLHACFYLYMLMHMCVRNPTVPLWDRAG